MSGTETSDITFKKQRAVLVDLAIALGIPIAQLITGVHALLLRAIAVS